MSKITIYRIENPVTMHGMWYKLDGSYAPFIFRLTEGKSRDLPMGWDARYGTGGRRWFSAGKSKTNMNQWFSPRDAFELKANGYELFQFEVSEYMLEEHQVLFTREGIIRQEIIPIEALWDIRQVVNAGRES